MDRRLGRYELRRVVGRGAAGTVWEAWDTTLTRRVAVKVVRSGDLDDHDLQEILVRFRLEAQFASRLSHPGVVQVFDYGEDAGEAYIVMEFVEGETLRELLNRGERVPLPRVAAIMTGVLQALEHCHRQGIVHRDIKPGNIMLPVDGGVKVADFGIARVEDSDLTITGTQMGTPLYMSPEQFTAREPVDFPTDIWSCGVMLYEMLTGARPFAGATPTMIGQAVVNDPFEPPSRRIAGVPASLDQVVAQALRKAPKERFPGAQAFASAIAAAMPSDPGAGGRDSGDRPGSKRLLAGGLLACLVAVVGAGGFFWFGGSPTSPPPSSRGTQTAPSPGVPSDSLLGRTAPAHPAGGLQVVPPSTLPAQVAALPCSTVSVMTDGAPGTTTFQGIIGSGAPRNALDAIVAQQPASSVTVAVQTFPQSDISCHLAELVRANSGDGSVRLTIRDGRTALLNGDEIRLRLRMPEFDGEVHLEDLNSDGRFGHLMEANLGTLPRQRARATIGLGRGSDDLIGRVSPPFGTDILVAIVASGPLFTEAHPQEEAGESFIQALDEAIGALRQQGGQVAADALVMTTARR